MSDYGFVSKAPASPLVFLEGCGSHGEREGVTSITSEAQYGGEAVKSDGLGLESCVCLACAELQMRIL